jgi:GNAT superfamily N-acetyltransferase
MDIRTMTTTDIPFAMRLKAQNNWNQLEADWRRQLELDPTSCFIAENNGQPLGTACACVFGDTAWINFVLVDQAQRGKGIGTALTKHVVQYLDDRGVATIRLDATPLGQPVYEKLGFVGDFTLDRFEGILPSKAADTALPSDEAGRVTPLTAAELQNAIAMDDAVSVAPREKLLRYMLETAPQHALQYAPGGRFKGFCMWRPGSNAWQIGPLQGTIGAGLFLLAHVTRRLAWQRVYIDVPKSHEIALIVAESLGLKLQRTFLRMCRGKSVSEREHLHLFWASFGPEKG